MPTRLATVVSGSGATSLTGVSKRFRTSWGKNVVALCDVSFTVGRGEIFGLLGPNGAGKSTTLKILLGFMKPSGGQGSLLGQPLGSVHARARLGFLPENPYFYDYLTAREFLDACASLSGMPRQGRAKRIERTLDRVGLDPGSKLRLRKFSKGMLQRAGLAQAILHDPDLLILDEPMSGLDPIGRRQVRDLILELKNEGKTIIFSSHVLPDAEALCERVGILVRGTLRRVGKVSDLLVQDASGFEIEAAELPPGLWQRWSAEGIARDGGDRILVAAPDRDALDQRLSRLLTAGAAILAVRPVQRSLEDVFLDQVYAGSAATAATGTHDAGPHHHDDRHDVEAA
jgi:ABC-2 type transport system ATP-binding protein